MSLLHQNKESRVLRKGSKVAGTRDVPDFSKVGGLGHHIETLREVIIFPLLHGHIFTHFNVKAPRGVLFYGPPGTGKTLVAGALASEINRAGIGKVTFFQRKGADMLDKWVGESEKKLRALFEKATKCRPSIIFFDEIDGLAPCRSDKNDHIHTSVVATLLALMDGLDTKPGVIVIAATNRIEALDPALRRPGRWDDIDKCEQHSIVSTLENIHAGLPVLTIASCTTDAPSMFHNFFYNNSTILIKIDDPTDEEREHFLAPLFFGEKCMSLHRVLENCKRSVRKVKPELDSITKSKKGNSEELRIEEVHSLTNRKRKCEDYTISNPALVKKIKLCEDKFGHYQSNSYIHPDNTQKAAEASSNKNQSQFEKYQARKRYFTRVFSDLLNQRNMWKTYSRSYALRSNCGSLGTRRTTTNSLHAPAVASVSFKKPVEDQMKQVYRLWKHTALVTSRHMAVTQLELLYDVISACISIHQHSFEALVEHLDNILKKIEYSNQITDSDTQSPQKHVNK